MKKKLKNARLINEKDLKQIVIEEGIIKDIYTKEDGNNDKNMDVIDLNGKLILPGFVDMHMHIDKSFTYPHLQNKSGTLLEAIERFDKYQSSITTKMLIENMSKSVYNAIRHGTTALRTHLDGGSKEYIQKVVEAYHIVKERFAKYIHMEAVMMCDLNMDKSLEKDVRWAIENGIELIGGAPHLSDNPQRNLNQIFDIGVTNNIDIDIHVDESDDPKVNSLPEIYQLINEVKYRGRVTVGHITSLSAMDEEKANVIMDMIKDADIGVVTLPGSNLYLLGRNDKGIIRRGLTRVRELRESDIPVAIGSDNIQDPFHPYGKSDLLQMALLCSYGAQMTSEKQMTELLEMISTIPSKIMNRSHGLEIGNKADFVILDTKNPQLVLSEQTATREVWKNGKQICKVTEVVEFESEPSLV